MKSIVLCDNAEPHKVFPLCAKYNLGAEVQGFYNSNKIGETDSIFSLYNDLLTPGMELHLHAPFWDLCLGNHNEKIAEVTRYFFDYAYGIAEKLGCRTITVHHGYIPGTSSPAKWAQRAAVFWKKFFDAHPGEIRICMENLLENDPDVLAAVVDAAGNERLMLNLDVGHAYCHSDVPVTEWIRRLGSRIGYVHLHQNHGAKDEHLGLRDGNMDMCAVLDTLIEHAPAAVWALECAPAAMEDSVQFLVEHGYL